MKLGTPFVVVLLAGLVMAGLIWADLALPAYAEDADPVEQVLLDPQATGLLVTTVAGQSQAESLGIQLGDVITSYAGKPTATLDDLKAAIGEAVGSPSIELVLVKPDGTEVKHTLAPGRIGVGLAPVTKGEPVGPLPPKTDFAFDFSRLEAGAIDDWYAFQLEGTLGKNGFEHVQISLQPDGAGGKKLVVRREVAFDGGQQWGVNHFDVKQEAALEKVPRILRWSFENPVSGFLGTGVVEAGTISFAWKSAAGETGDDTHPLPTDLPAIPSYLVETLASFMPQKAGTCFHYRAIQDGSGAVGRPTALLAAGAEEIVLEGETIQTFRFEVKQLGGAIANRYWVDAEGHVVQANYGAASTTRTTQAKALAGLNAEIKPRTAGDSASGTGAPKDAAK